LRCHKRVLRLSRPGNKCLAGTFRVPSPTGAPKVKSANSSGDEPANYDPRNEKQEADERPRIVIDEFHRGPTFDGVKFAFGRRKASLIAGSKGDEERGVEDQGGHDRRADKSDSPYSAEPVSRQLRSSTPLAPRRQVSRRDASRAPVNSAPQRRGRRSPGASAQARAPRIWRPAHYWPLWETDRPEPDIGDHSLGAGVNGTVTGDRRRERAADAPGGAHPC
jgi:hypothetical protein